MLGVTEDAVLARQRCGELPGRLTHSGLQADCLDAFLDAPPRDNPDDTDTDAADDQDAPGDPGDPFEGPW